MRVRLIQLRILGAALTGLWLLAFGLVLVGYRPGGPADTLVGLAAPGPALVAAAGLRWPPVARGDRAYAAIAWLGLGAILLLVPSLAGLVGQLTGGGPQTLLPSLEAAYPWLLALLATGLYTGLGLARRRLGGAAMRRSRLVQGALIAAALVMATGSAFAASAIANELARAGRPALGSRFGPTDPAADPPPCTGPAVAGTTARLTLRVDGSIDGRYTGLVTLEGRRDGEDVAWSGFAATRLTLGQTGVVRLGDRAWNLSPASPWLEAELARVDRWDTDRRIVSLALRPAAGGAPEDRGIAFVDGARARHCRFPLDGATLRAFLPAVDLLVGGADISRWRGDLDVWIFADGQLGQADGTIDGPAPDLGDDVLQAGVRFRLLAYDRGAPVTVEPPVP